MSTKAFAALSLALLLGGCEPTEEQINRVKEALPAGCSVHDLGSYGDVSVLVVVTCEGRSTSTAAYAWHSGKSTHYAVSATVYGKP